MAVLEKQQEIIDDDDFSHPDGGDVDEKCEHVDGGAGEGGENVGYHYSRKADCFDAGDDISELGNTYFGDTSPAHVISGSYSISLEEENQRLKAELYLLRSRSELSVVYNQCDPYPTKNVSAPELDGSMEESGLRTTI